MKEYKIVGKKERPTDMKDGEFCRVNLSISRVEREGSTGIQSEGSICFEGCGSEMIAALISIFSALNLPKDNDGEIMLAMAAGEYFGLCSDCDGCEDGECDGYDVCDE